MFKNWEMSHFKRIQIFLENLSNGELIFPFPFDKADPVLCATVVVNVLCRTVTGQAVYPAVLTDPISDRSETASASLGSRAGPLSLRLAGTPAGSLEVPLPQRGRFLPAS